MICHTDKDKFHQQLQDLEDTIPRHDIKIIMGHISAQIGGNRWGFENAVGPQCIWKERETASYRFVLWTTSWLASQCSCTKIGTIMWILSNHRTATQIDHFINGPSWRVPCLQDAQCYIGADVNSNHCLTIAKLKGQKHRKQLCSGSVMWKSWKFQKSTVRFQATIQNQFHTISELLLSWKTLGTIQRVNECSSYPQIPKDIKGGVDEWEDLEPHSGAETATPLATS